MRKVSTEFAQPSGEEQFLGRFLLRRRHPGVNEQAPYRGRVYPEQHLEIEPRMLPDNFRFVANRGLSRNEIGQDQ